MDRERPPFNATMPFQRTAAVCLVFSVFAFLDNTRSGVLPFQHGKLLA
jgi:hypothetical protein